MSDNPKNGAYCKGQRWNKVILIWILINISIFAAKAQQDPQFSQNWLNQLTVNPGFAGSSGPINVSILNRFQWVGFPGAPVTTVFNTDAMLHLIGKNDGVGFSIINDVIGFEKNVSVGLSYAWRTRLGEGNLGSGVSLGLMNKNLNFNLTGIEGSDLINLSDPSIPQGNVSGIMADIGLGLFYNDQNLELAISGKHLNRPSFTFNQLGRYTLLRSYYISGRYTLQMADEKLQALPSFFFKTDPGSWQADLDMTFQYDKRFWGGIGYRLGDAIIITAGTELWNGIKFGYSYDVSISALSRYNSGSHEFYLAYSFLLYKKHDHPYKSVRFL